MTWFYQHPFGDAYYDEFDPGAAAWLRELMQANLIAPGVIDTRSILEVKADELSEFTQCHFFAGIGGWSYALRLAGWPDDKPVWTGSPPCQPFSAAGQGLSQDDPRHLAPHFIQLVGTARPSVLFGEQVASAEVFGPATGKARSRSNGQAELWCEGCGGFHKATRPITAPECPHCDARSGFFDYSAATEGYDPDPKWAWLDDLQNRLEAAHYSTRASDIPAAGVGAPHIRQRTFFGAYDLRSAASGLEHASSTRGPAWIPEPTQREERQPGEPHNAMRGLSGPNSGRPSSDRLAQPDSRERSGIAEHGEHVTDRAQGGRVQRDSEPARDSCAGGLEHGAGDGRIKRRTQSEGRGAVGGCSSERLADADMCRHKPEPDAKRESVFGKADGQIATGQQPGDTCAGAGLRRTNPLDGFWANADWLFCRDGKWRPVEPGLEPLAHGLPGRVGLLRGYGNAICPWAAKEFIETFFDTCFFEAQPDAGPLRMIGAPQTVLDEVFG